MLPTFNGPSDKFSDGLKDTCRRISWYLRGSTEQHRRQTAWQISDKDTKNMTIMWRGVLRSLLWYEKRRKTILYNKYWTSAPETTTNQSADLLYFHFDWQPAEPRYRMLASSSSSILNGGRVWCSLNIIFIPPDYRCNMHHFPVILEPNDWREKWESCTHTCYLSTPPITLRIKFNIKETTTCEYLEGINSPEN